MSSGTEAVGAIAVAVMLPVGAAVGAVYGAGWLAWQSGKLLVDVNSAVDRQIAEKKKRQEAAATHRKRSALAAHDQLVGMCTTLLSQIDENQAAVGAMDHAEIEQLRAELYDICHESVPDDATQIESLNALGYLKLERLVARQQRLSSLQMESSGDGLYHGLTLAEMMRDMKVALTAMNIQATQGKNVQVADPVVLERVKLNEKLADVTARTMAALEYVAELSSEYGLSSSGSAWFHSCFNGVDEQIGLMYMPTTPNSELKKGIRRLEGILEQYDLLIPSIESDQKKLTALYQVYADASKALGEPIVSIRSFKSPKELEDRLHVLEERSKKAQECAEIYRALGSEAYICYAWDQELRALGYEVHSRKDIAEMAKYRPQHARLGESKLPFYQWKDDDLTQLYSMASECSLQVIVHDDGAVTMQTISDAEDDKAKAVQTGHCSLLKKLHENLRKNWFILYDYQETASPDEVVTAAEWFGSEESAWKSDRGRLITEQRNKGKGESRTMQSQ